MKNIPIISSAFGGFTLNMNQSFVFTGSLDVPTVIDPKLVLICAETPMARAFHDFENPAICAAQAFSGEREIASRIFVFLRHFRPSAQRKDEANPDRQASLYERKFRNLISVMAVITPSD